MRIRVTVDHIDLEGDHGEIDSVEVTCTRCGRCEQVYGTSERSIKRGCILLRENCPKGQRNFYTPNNRRRR